MFQLIDCHCHASTSSLGFLCQWLARAVETRAINLLSAQPELGAPAMASKLNAVLEAPVVTSVPNSDRARLDDLRNHLDSCDIGFQKCPHCHFAAGVGCPSSKLLSLVVLQLGGY